MLRTAFGAFDALLGGSAVRGALARDAVGKRIWAARLPAQAPARSQRALMSQLAAPAARRTVAQPRSVRLRTPFLRPKRPFHSSRARRSDAASKSGDAAPAESLSLSQRLKKLSREYGWTAVGIYLSLSVLDFPFCFLLVRTVGTEKIGELAPF